MSRPQYDVVSQYTGTGLLSDYTFDFLISKKEQVQVIITDSNDVELQRVYGDDVTILDDVLFDDEGGGTVKLASALTLNHKLLILLAPDEPVQESRLRNKSSFTLRSIEAALDELSGQIQRAFYKLKGTFSIHELDIQAGFDPRLPPGIADQAGRVLQVNADGDGLEYGASTGDISGVSADAAAAAASAIAAALSAADSAASATAADASATAAAASAQDAQDIADNIAIPPPTFVDFNGPTSGSLSRNEIGIIRAGASFALALDNTALVAGDVIEVKNLGLAGNLTVTPTGADIDGASSKVFPSSTNASYKFRYTGTEWITT